jgi:peptidoglycan hydrolase-like protein with peptidoglycan-binding domain
MGTITATRTDATPLAHPSGAGRYQPGPRLEDVAAGLGILGRGHSGPEVRLLQTLLNRLGAQPPLAEDGLFGPKTEAALAGFQSRAGAPAATGGLDMATLVLMGSALGHGGPQWGAGSGAGQRGEWQRAPRYGAQAPRGSIPARQLAQPLEPGRPRPGSGPTGAAPSAPLGPVSAPAGDTPADSELAQLQATAVSSARRELEAGVREQGGANRGARVEQYAARANMPPGAWCGYFTGFNYSEAARAAGGEFTGINGFHSMQKARSFFEYRSYTDNSAGTNARLDTLRETHLAQGSARRWMTLSGSGGQTHAARGGRPHEVYEPGNLPIRAGDTAVFSHGHVGMVESYDQRTGRLTTIEGNVGNRVQRKTYDLNNPQDRARFEGFGRPARGDFSSPSGAPAAAPAPAPAPATPAPGSATPPAAAPTAATPPAATPAARSADPAAPAAPVTERAPPTTGGPNPLAGLPPRPADAPTGSEFLARTAGLSRAEREDAILQEVLRGNVPASLRQGKPVTVTGRGADGQTHTAELFVAPDYLAIGSDDDFVRIPMTPATAQRIADATHASLPTSRMVDEIHRSAEARLTPQPIPPSAQMMSNGYYGRHQQLVEGQRDRAGIEDGTLISGHKKDVVLSQRLAQHPDRVAIYGWHQANGRPIQPLSTVHEASYADYSHGVRLVADRVKIDGQWRPLAEVLADPNLAPLLSAEGPMRVTRVPG